MPVDKRITELPTGTALDGTELTHVVQGGANIQSTVQAQADFTLGDMNASDVENALGYVAADEEGTVKPQGTYAAATAYAVNDAVKYGGRWWVCLQADTDQTPAIGSAYWEPLGGHLTASPADKRTPYQALEEGGTILPALRMLADDLNAVTFTRDGGGLVTEATANGLVQEVRRDVDGLIEQVGGKEVTSTFTRTSPAWNPYTGAESASGVPRFVEIAGTVGLMVEEGSTNLCLQSTQIQTAPWTSLGLTVTGNATTAPDGTTTGCQIVSSSTGDHLRQAINVTAGTTYTFSFFAKNNGGTLATYSVYNVTGAADVVASTSYFSQINGASWTRVSFSFTAPVGCTQVYVYMSRNAASVGVNLFLWGACLEAKAYPTSPIKTEGSTVTRAAETLAIPTADVLNLSEGAIAIPFYVDGDLGASPNKVGRALLRHRPAALAKNDLSVYRAVDGKWYVQSRNDAGPSSLSTGWTSTLAMGYHVCLVSWTAARLSLWFDGVEVGYVDAPNLPEVAETFIYAGSFSDGTGQLGQPMGGIHFFYEALTDEEKAEYSTLATFPTAPTPKTSLYLPLDSDLLNVARVVDLTYTDGLLTGMTRGTATLG